MTTLVMGDVARRIAAERGVAVPASDPAAVVESLGTISDTRVVDQLVASTFIQIWADTDAVMTALQQSLSPVEPTEDDQRELYASLTYLNQAITDPFEDVQPFLGKDIVGDELALRDLLEDGIERYGITINPRYAPLTWQVEVWFNPYVSGYFPISLATR